jgi:DNA-binding transcriptional LysR family regulator
MDRITSMTVFVRVAELGGFAAAADEFELSATMVGKHIKALEDRLGSRLIQRTTRRQHLTEVGRLYYERCKSLLAELETMDASAEELRAAPRGQLRITAPVSFGARRLAPALAIFLREHPEVQIDLVLNDRVVDLVEEGFDAAIRTGRLADSSLVARPLATYRMLIGASPAYLAERGTPRKPQDLTQHECLNFSYWPQRNQWRLSARGVEHNARVSGRLRINNGEALRQAALAGFGIVLQSQALLEEDIRSGRLVHILPRYELPTPPVHLVYRPDRRPTPKLQRFIEFVLERFSQPESSLPRRKIQTG